MEVHPVAERAGLRCTLKLFAQSNCFSIELAHYPVIAQVFLINRGHWFSATRGRCARRGFQKIISGAVGNNNRNIGVLNDEFSKPTRLGFTDLVYACIRGKEFVIVRKIAIEVNTTSTVFIPHLVMVIIDSLGQVTPRTHFAFEIIGFQEQALVHRVEKIVTVLILDAHPRDKAISVKVFGAIFIHQPIMVVIGRFVV